MPGEAALHLWITVGQSDIFRLRSSQSADVTSVYLHVLEFQQYFVAFFIESLHTSDEFFLSILGF